MAGDERRAEVEAVALHENYRLFVSDNRTVLVRMWTNGEVEVCLRDQPDGTWEPPIRVEEES